MTERTDAAAVLELVTDVAEVATWDWNRDTGEVWWNTWHARLLGYEHREGPRTYDEFRVRVHPDDLDALERVVQDAVDTGELFQSRFRVVLPDGAVRHLRGQGRVLDDQPHRMVGVLVDTTPSVDAADRERDLLRNLHEADRRARLSFAADIHDRPLQRLFAAHLSATGALSALRTSGSADPRILTRLQWCVDAIEEAQRALRALLAEMHEETDAEHLDAVVYLHQLAHDVFDGRSERIVLLCPAPVPVLGSLLPEVLNIAREAMQNIAKHAHASTVTIYAGDTAGEVEIRIIDDGVGFDPAATSEVGHYGVRTMAHRAQVLGGRLTTTSEPGSGTTVVLSFPRS